MQTPQQRAAAAAARDETVRAQLASERAATLAKIAKLRAMRLGDKAESNNG